MATNEPPKLTVRHVREHATFLTRMRSDLEACRAEIVVDLQEAEQVVAALKRQLEEVDNMLHKGLRSV